MKSFAQFKKEMLRDRELRKAYDALEPEFALARAVIERRLKKGLTQTALARKMKTKQSAIARLESGSYNPTIKFLGKVADALDARLKVSIS